MNKERLIERFGKDGYKALIDQGYITAAGEIRKDLPLRWDRKEGKFLVDVFVLPSWEYPEEGEDMDEEV